MPTFKQFPYNKIPKAVLNCALKKDTEKLVEFFLKCISKNINIPWVIEKEIINPTPRDLEDLPPHNPHDYWDDVDWNDDPYYTPPDYKDIYFLANKYIRNKTDNTKTFDDLTNNYNGFRTAERFLYLLRGLQLDLSQDKIDTLIRDYVSCFDKYNANPGIAIDTFLDELVIMYPDNKILINCAIDIIYKHVYKYDTDSQFRRTVTITNAHRYKEKVIESAINLWKQYKKPVPQELLNIKNETDRESDVEAWERKLDV